MWGRGSRELARGWVPLDQGVVGVSTVAQFTGAVGEQQLARRAAVTVVGTRQLRLALGCDGAGLTEVIDGCRNVGFFGRVYGIMQCLEEIYT